MLAENCSVVKIHPNNDYDNYNRDSSCISSILVHIIYYIYFKEFGTWSSFLIRTGNVVADELFEWVWPFCEVALKGLSIMTTTKFSQGNQKVSKMVNKNGSNSSAFKVVLWKVLLVGPTLVSFIYLFISLSSLFK